MDLATRFPLPARTRRWPALALALIALALIAPEPNAAHADDTDQADEDKARKLFMKARDLMRAGHFAEACPLLEKSLQRFDGIGTRGKLAECYDKNQQVASAWRLYREVERLAGELDQAKRAKAARERAKALEPRLSRLLISVGDNRKLAELQVLHNGRPVPAAKLDIEMLVDSGSHHIAVAAPGYTGWEGTVRVAESESKSVAIPGLIKLDRDGKPIPPASSNAASYTGLTLLGLGAAAGLGASYFGTRAYLHSRAVSAPCKAELFLCEPDEIAANDDARTNAARANLALAVSAPLVATGLVIWLLSRRGQRSDTSAETSAVASGQALHLLPTITRESASLSLSGRF